MEPRSLVLEITEHGMLDDAMAAAEQLRVLRSIGVSVAMDDFGTGYSSLVQLRSLPVDFLKIDQSFVAGLTDGGDDMEIVRASVRLARSLGLGVVAEGVETAEQFAMLRQLKCDMAQGFHFARPMPADEVATWWEARSRGDSLLPPASPPVARNRC